MSNSIECCFYTLKSCYTFIISKLDVFLYLFYTYSGRKRRPSNSSDDIMDDCMAAMVLMSLSCSPKSPRLPEAIIYQCTWPGCLHQCDHCHQIEKHVRTQHLGLALILFHKLNSHFLNFAIFCLTVLSLRLAKLWS